MSVTNPHIGKPASRYDGPDKVSGRACYAADFVVTHLSHGVVVSSEIAVGRIAALHLAEAQNVPGVLAIFSHLHCPPVANADSAYQDQAAPPGSPFRPFQDDQIRFAGQPVALVVAEDFETARHAASLISAEYVSGHSHTNLSLARDNAYEPAKKRAGIGGPPKQRGDTGKAFEGADKQVATEYRSPPEHHNPMEMHATTVVWNSEKSLLIHDKTQGAQNSQAYVCQVFGYDESEVVVASPFVGGAFGSGLRPQYQLFLAVLAARALKRSVQVVLTRQQMFTFGHRPETIQTVGLASDLNGKLTGIRHSAIAATSSFEDYQENVVGWGEQLYETPNAMFGYKLVKLDIYSPADMRAPGGALGMFALECAMDELAYEVGVDPLELRLKNYSETDQQAGKPFSTKELRACYEKGADRFGWSRRTVLPRSVRKGHELQGMGMASGIWEAYIVPTKAKACLLPDGRIEVSSAMADIGTGTYTILSQIAATTLHVGLDAVTVKLGDSRLPKAPIEGGSWGAASAGTAVQAACNALKTLIAKAAVSATASPLTGTRASNVRFENGALVRIDDTTKRMSYSAIANGNTSPIEAEGSSDPYYFETAKSMLGLKKYSSFAHSAVFAEVSVDDDLGVVRVDRIVIAVDAGRILNPKTARSQIIGGVIWGIGMATHEASLLDHAHGRFMNHSFAEYHIPVNADIHDIDVIFVETPDTHLNPLGIKGLGEIGVVGTAAAIANAVFNATGKRIRNLPITLEKLL